MNRQDGPIGYFVHHQGRGHAERAASIANAMAGRRAVTLFSARDDIYPALHGDVSICKIPSLFEPAGEIPPRMSALETPATMHCAPVGWQTITSATATLAQWFHEAAPALFVTDVSAELGQFARICSIPHVAVLQHGNRTDPGHQASYDAAAGLLAPYSKALEQEDRTPAMIAKTHYAPGVGISLGQFPDMLTARETLGLPKDREIVLVIAGGGGRGTPSAPLTLGARAEPETLWITIGGLETEWHETPPGNLQHKGWVDNPEQWVAAADRVVSSCGNTTVHMVLAAGRPWVVVPEWRYFDEQIYKAQALERAGVAAVSLHWPSHREGWEAVWQEARGITSAAQTSLFDADAAQAAADWLNGLACELWDAEKPRLAVVA